MQSPLTPPLKGAGLIRQLFDRISHGYDLFNTAFSLGFDRLWRRKTAMVVGARGPQRIVDLCTGTGKLLFALAHETQAQQLIGIDFSRQMLAKARSRCEMMNANHAHHRACRLIQADSLAIPLASRSVDCLTSSFSLRNLEDLEQAFREAHRVLKDGGAMVILETSQPRSRWLRMMRDFYLTWVMPLIGFCSTARLSPFLYFRRSVMAFDTPGQLTGRLKRAGFQQVEWFPLTGGMVAICQAIK